MGVPTSTAPHRPLKPHSPTFLLQCFIALCLADMCFCGPLPKTLVIGNTVPLVHKSGYLDEEGAMVNAAAHLAAKHVNADTTMLDLKRQYGTAVRVQQIDDFFDIGASLFQTLKLVQEHDSIAIIGTKLSMGTEHAALVAGNFHNAILLPIAPATFLSHRGEFPTLLRMMPSDENQHRALTWMCKNAFNWQRIGLLYDNGLEGMDGSQDFMSAAKEFDLDVVSSQMFELEGDYTLIKPLLTTMLDANVKVFVLLTTDADKPFRAAKELGVIGRGSGLQWLGSHQTLNPRFRTRDNADLAPVLDGFIAVRPRVDTTTDAFKALAQQWKQRTVGVDFPARSWKLMRWDAEAEVHVEDRRSKVFYDPTGNDIDGTLLAYDSSRDVTMDVYAANSYEAVWTIAHAIKHAFDNNATYIQTLTDANGAFTDHEARYTFAKLVLEWVKQSDYTGVSGPVQFNPENGNRIQPMDILSIWNGEETKWGVWSDDSYQMLQGGNMTWTNGATGVDKAPLDHELCLPGTYRINGGCMPCAADTYSDVEALLACKPCPEGQGTLGETGQIKCKLCPAGQYKQGTGGGCLLCDAGTVSDKEGSRLCSPCSAGTFAPEKGLTKCTPCEDGFFQPSISQAKCDPCPSGMFRSKEEELARFEGGKGDHGIQCVRCPVNTFQPHPGSTECFPCRNGKTTFETGGTALDDCGCPDGKTWNRVEDKCEPCPEGVSCNWFEIFSTNNHYRRPEGFEKLTEADQLKSLKMCYGPKECPAALLLPEVKPGFMGFRTARKAIEHFTAPDIYKCQNVDTLLYSEACPGGPLVWTEESGKQQQLKTSTAYLDPSVCGHGLTGVACAVCPTGSVFDPDRKECDVCSAGDTAGPIIGIITLFGILAPVLYLMFNIGSFTDVYDSMTIGLSASQLLGFAQGLHVLVGLSIPWDTLFLEMTSFLSLLRFEFPFISSGCAVQDTKFRYAFTLFFPALICATIVAYYFVSQVVVRTAPYKAWQTKFQARDEKYLDTVQGRCAQYRVTTTRRTSRGQHTNKPSLYEVFVHGGGPKAGLCRRMCGVMYYLYMAFMRRLASGSMTVDSTINTIGYTVNMFYVSVCLNCFVPIETIESPNGTKSIKRFPFVLLGTSEWSKMMGISAAGMFVYICVWLPVMCWAAYVAPDKTLENPSFLARWCFLFPMFRPEYWWWSVCCVIRNMLQAFVPIMGQGKGRLQAAIACVIHTFALVMHMKLFPYKSPVNNFLDGSLTTILLLTSLCGVYFAAIPPDSTPDPFFTHFLIVLLSLAFFVIISSVLYVSCQTNVKVKVEEDSDVLCLDLFQLANTIVQSDQTEVQRSVRRLLGYDRETIKQSCFLLSQEVLVLRNPTGTYKSNGLTRTKTAKSMSNLRRGGNRRLIISEMFVRQGTAKHRGSVLSMLNSQEMRVLAAANAAKTAALDLESVHSSDRDQENSQDNALPPIELPPVCGDEPTNIALGASLGYRSKTDSSGDGKKTLSFSKQQWPSAIDSEQDSLDALIFTSVKPAVSRAQTKGNKDATASEWDKEATIKEDADEAVKTLPANMWR